MGKVWIETALNGPWSRARQPGIPDDVEAIVAEGIACASAGACIIHAHAYERGGPQTFDWQVYARIIEGIRAKIDVPVYPSIPMAERMSAEARFAHIGALAERGLLEFAVVDPGSVNFTALVSKVGARSADLSQSRGAHSAWARSGEALRLPSGLRDLRAGVHARRRGACGDDRRQDADLSAHVLGDGFPPRPWALAAHCALIDEAARGAPWMIAGLGVDIRRLVGEAVARGGHVRVGLEDAPFGCVSTNVALVGEAVRLVRAAGGEPATVAEMREGLRISNASREHGAIG
jgi:3-keto-5-aminohexanoate cleavage enzyme